MRDLRRILDIGDRRIVSSSSRPVYDTIHLSKNSPLLVHTEVQLFLQDVYAVTAQRVLDLLIGPIHPSVKR